LHADVRIGNPYVAAEAAPPPAPWTEEDLASRAAFERCLESLSLPVHAEGGFWFAFVAPEGADPVEVRLFTDVARPDRVVPMEHHGEGIHTLRFPCPEVDRVEYSFQIVHASGRLEWSLDPRNDRRIDAPFGPKSEALAEGYRPPSWVEPLPREERGTVRELRVPGLYGRPRPAWTWLPRGVRGDADLPLVVFLDGGDYLRYAGARHVLEGLVAEGRLAPCRALFLPPRDRFQEYSANRRTAHWLAHSLPVLLGRAFHVPRRPERRIGVGASLGGLALLFAHHAEPEAFGGLVLQSGSFFDRELDAMESAFAHFGRICRFVRGLAKPEGRYHAPPIPVRLTCGTAEENLINNRRMHDTLRRRGHPVSLAEARDSHNWIAWRDSLGEELAALLPGDGPGWVAAPPRGTT